MYSCVAGIHSSCKEDLLPLAQVILGLGNALLQVTALCIADAPLYPWPQVSRCTSLPSRDHQKCLQTLPLVPRGLKSLPFKDLYYKMRCVLARFYTGAFILFEALVAH